MSNYSKYISTLLATSDNGKLELIFRLMFGFIMLITALAK
ncbi:hypothetical protein JCM19231_2166 [Vibrio ishigakensis]|uniref:Uncharacterized protein n=1 Tax=Vibrio ishigakensis TaxID=1481914 RepID=A0A0B8NWN5_9VIBR|nr:hypothetical protein JCM19231_2166 [Vibrio ishigakensis]